MKWEDFNLSDWKIRFSDLEINELVMSNPLGILQAPEFIKKDINIALAVLHHNADAFKYFSISLKDNKEVAIKAVSDDSSDIPLRYASKRLQADREVVQVAISKYGLSIKFASLELRNDRELIKIAVSTDDLGYIFKEEEERDEQESEELECPLKYVSETLKNDEEIVRLAVSNYGFSIYHASPELQTNIDILIIALKKNPECYSWISDYFKDNRTAFLFILISLLNPELVIEGFNTILEEAEDILNLYFSDKYKIKELTNDPAYLIIIDLILLKDYVPITFQNIYIHPNDDIINYVKQYGDCYTANYVRLVVNKRHKIKKSRSSSKRQCLELLPILSDTILFPRRNKKLDIPLEIAYKIDNFLKPTDNFYIDSKGRTPLTFKIMFRVKRILKSLGKL